MDKFTYMQPAVEALCKSLIEETHLWKFESPFLRKKGDRVTYWKDYGVICQIWDGTTRHTVFSYEQGRRVFIAYELAREKQANAAQTLVLQSLLKKNEDATSVKIEKPWWKFW